MYSNNNNVNTNTNLIFNNGGCNGFEILCDWQD